ncbi:MAG TPA: chloride channel protein [Opitutaceae bacterium]|nr:chloride channel protein [Opitutaceae bacterium]
MPEQKSSAIRRSAAQHGTAGSNRILATSVLAALVGSAAGGAAYVLYSLIVLVSNLVFYQRWSFEHHDAAEHTLGALVIIVPALGGIVVGLMAKYGSSKIRGHGIPEAMEAVLFNQSRIAPQVALLKPASVAIAIGTGGPFGAEGPIIQTGGALGSIIGQLLHVTAAERKVLLASGAAAGMAATFSTPIAAVILAIELLLFEYRARSFIPLVIASTLATAVRFALMGRGAMFSVGAVDFGFPAALPWYVPLGIVCGLAAVGFSKALYWIEDRFEHLPIDEMWWPAIGGLGLGVIAFFVPRVLGVGYGTISDILNARLAIDVLALILVAKSAALLVSLGSGTSGGLLAPMFTTGAAIGGLYAFAVNHFWPGAHLSASAFALVAMAAYFGSAARAPFTFIIFAFELTRDYDSVLPLMIVVVIAHGIALRFMPNSIMTEKLSRRGLRVHQEYEVDVLHQVMVATAMDKNPTVLAAERTIGEVGEAISRGDPTLTRHQAMLIVNREGHLAGIMTRGDLLRALEKDPSGRSPVLAAATTDVEVTYPDETVHDAVLRMLERGVGRVPVVSRENPRKILGYLGRSAVIDVRMKRIHEDLVRQPGWLGSSFRNDKLTPAAGE